MRRGREPERQPRILPRGRHRAQPRDDEDDDNFQPAITTGNTTDSCGETIRRQHIESVQRS